MRENLHNGFQGLLAGAGIGALAGLGVCVWLIDQPLWFPGDTIVIGAMICGLLGLLFGESFLDWLRENWWWFS